MQFIEVLPVVSSHKPKVLALESISNFEIVVLISSIQFWEHVPIRAPMHVKITPNTNPLVQRLAYAGQQNSKLPPSTLNTGVCCKHPAGKIMGAFFFSRRDYTGATRDDLDEFNLVRR